MERLKKTKIATQKQRMITGQRRLRSKRNEGNSYSREKETKKKKLKIARSNDENIL
jgi:hypothetical protein